MANRMLQYLAALSLADASPDCVVTGFDIPEWSLSGPPSAPGKRRWPKIDIQSVDTEWLRAQINSGQVRNIRITSVASDMALLPSRIRANNVFHAPDQPFFQTGADDLVIHVRLGDILQPGRHAAYGPLPIAWYRQIIGETGLRPVFVGELSDDPYSAALRRAFPEAMFLEGGTVLHDFQTLRHAHNVVIAISTFSWMAAWLGAKRRVYCPMMGMLNPAQEAQINLIPLGDPRFRYTAFPIRHWRAQEADLRAVIDGPALGEAIDETRAAGIVARAAQKHAPERAAWRERFSERMASAA